MAAHNRLNDSSRLLAPS